MLAKGLLWIEEKAATVVEGTVLAAVAAFQAKYSYVPAMALVPIGVTLPAQVGGLEVIRSARMPARHVLVGGFCEPD
jgi:hypothetical protein